MTLDDDDRDRYEAVGGLEFHFREWGEADSPPVVILHGLTAHSWEFDRVASALAKDYHVLVVDQRGHGATSWAEEYSPELMADDIAALVRALGLGRVRVVGHSMGGVNGWWLAARHPEVVERLVSIDITPAAIVSEELAAGWMAALDANAAAEYADPEEAVREFVTDFGGPHEEELRAFVLKNLRTNAEGRWVWRFDSLGLKQWMVRASSDEAAHLSVLRTIACPVLVIRAGQSPFTDRRGAERMVQDLPRGGLVEIADAGHDIHIEQFEELLAALRAFLDMPEA